MDWVEVAEIGLVLKVEWGRCSLASIGKRLTGMAARLFEANAGQR
jgi:hypothetical protein